MIDRLVLGCCCTNGILYCDCDPGVLMKQPMRVNAGRLVPLRPRDSFDFNAYIRTTIAKYKCTLVLTAPFRTCIHSRVPRVRVNPFFNSIECICGIEHCKLGQETTISVVSCSPGLFKVPVSLGAILRPTFLFTFVFVLFLFIILRIRPFNDDIME